MASREEITGFLDGELNPDHFKQVEDAKFNGVLVDGSEEIETAGVCTNVTFETIEKAKEEGCDLVISHHGGWKEFDQDLLEEEKQRIEEAGMNWYIAHETMDCKQGYGISASLAEKLGIEVRKRYSEHAGGKVGVTGELKVSREEFIDRLEEIEPDYKVIGNLDDAEKFKIGVVGGGGGAFTDIIQDTCEEDCDLFITGSSTFFGEIYAHDKDLNMIVMSETSSERWGMYALGDKVQEEFEKLEIIRIEERNW